MTSSALASPGMKAEPQTARNPFGFHAPEPGDILWAKPLLAASGRMGSEYCFGNLYAWAPLFRTEIARAGPFLLSRHTSQAGTPSYSLPVGDGSLRDAVEPLRTDAGLRGVPLRIRGLTAVDADRLKDALPGRFRIEGARNEADYIYRREHLALLPGKRYHNKRNHIARFSREHRWEYREIRPRDLEDCLAMVGRWEQLNAERDPQGLEWEFEALGRCAANFELFECRGGLLRAEGEVAAFTLGETINARVFCTHFEKAYAGMPGAYQMINREFAANTLGAFEFINREEDMGNEGLRRAKLSYEPTLLLEKFIATEL